MAGSDFSRQFIVTFRQVFVARAGVVGEAALEGADERHQVLAQSRVGRGVFLASQKVQ